MKAKQLLIWIFGLLAGLFFVWLALQGLNLNKVGETLRSVKTGWILPFALAALFSNILRAFRWKLLFRDFAGVSNHTIIAATLAGYAANIAVPRLGEVSRCGYLSKNSKIPIGEALATVVLERTFDVVSLLLLLVVTMVFIVSDAQTIENLLGITAMDVYKLLATVLLLLIAFAVGVYLLHRNQVLFDGVRNWLEMKIPWLKKLFTIGDHMLEGLIAVKHLKQWPLFLLYTMLIWFGYVVMSWIPFYAFADGALNGLSLLDAFDVMVISSIGVVIPSPSGVGTYHFFTQKALTLLHGVSPEPAIAYAVAAHAVMILSILLSAAVAVVYDRIKLK